MTFEAMSQHLEAFLALKRARPSVALILKATSVDASDMKRRCSAAFLNDGDSTDAPGRFAQSLRWIG